MQTISIHAPREGGDSSANRCRSCWIHFNPRPPRGGRRENANYIQGNSEISIHAPREGGDEGTPLSPSIYERFQSTPPARGATNQFHTCSKGQDISIHAPREGGDTFPGFRTLTRSTFQSTPPARGATKPPNFGVKMDADFNPRPPRGGRQLDVSSIRYPTAISIHAPREGGDLPSFPGEDGSIRFQSTPPARGATAEPSL